MTRKQIVELLRYIETQTRFFDHAKLVTEIPDAIESLEAEDPTPVTRGEMLSFLRRVERVMPHSHSLRPELDERIAGFEREPELRKPVGIAQQGEYSQAVLCDDGAVFTRQFSGWKEEFPVPGTKRALEKARG